MKKHLPIAALAAAALVLAGCAAADGDSSATQGTTTVDDITWQVGDDGIPTLDFEFPGTTEVTEARSVTAGDGDSIAEGSVVSVEYTLISGTDGTMLSSTYEMGMQDSIPVEQTSLDPALYEVLVESSVGEEIIFATRDQTALEQPAPGEELDPDALTPAVYMAITVVDVMVPLERAEGAEVTPQDGLPVVTLDETGKPSVEVGDAEEPDDLVVQPLIEGEGDELELGDSLVAHYSGWVWDGEQFDSSWERGASATFPFQEGGLIQGWTDGLVGHPVGSQVLLVIPSELGYGAQGSGDAIPPDSTLVFVVDILGAN